MRRTTGLLIGMTMLGACGSEQIATGKSPAIQAPAAAAASRVSEADVRKDLATLHRVTEPFRDFSKAEAAGWGALITPCMADPVLGGMGLHYGNPAIIDGTVQVDQPELLLYEPAANGSLQLVAVEYIIPYTFVARDAVPPELFGRQFKQNDVFQLWGLHAWVWKQNASGVFADWNPLVSCQFATSTSPMSHH